MCKIVDFLSRPPVRNRIVLALWLAVAGAAIVRVSVLLSHPMLPGEDFRRGTWISPGSHPYLLDFRDTIWTPGRFLLAGGNPYDPATYLAANPWAMFLALYAPAWLLLAIPLAPLPYLISVVVFQILSLGVAVVMLRVLCRWALPTLTDVTVPAGLLWMNIWLPGRAVISQQLGSLLAVLGVALVLRSLMRSEMPSGLPTDANPSPSRTAVDRACAVGVALALVKVQFSAIALVGFVGGRHREVWRGIVGLGLLSMPIVVACAVAAGGPVEFVRSVLRDFEVQKSVGIGLSALVQRRLDLLGLLARYGLDHPPLWLQIGVPLLVLVVVPLIVIRVTRNPLLVSAVICSSILVGIYHNPYDLPLLFIPIAVGVGMVIRGEVTSVAERIALSAFVLVVLHLHTVSRILLGLDMRTADTVDLALTLIGLASAMYGALFTPRRWPYTRSRITTPIPKPTHAPPRTAYTSDGPGREVRADIYSEPPKA